MVSVLAASVVAISDFSQKEVEENYTPDNLHL